MQLRGGSGTICRTVAAAALLAVTAGLALPLAPAGAQPAHPKPPPEGIWQVDGYGEVFTKDRDSAFDRAITVLSRR